MVDAYDIGQGKLVLKSPDPPAESICLQRIPVIYWIPPQLTGIAESIWWYSAHRGEGAIRIHLEIGSVAPSIYTIGSDEYWNITNNGDVFCIRILLERRKLLEKEVLQDFPPSNLRLFQLRPPLYSIRISSGELGSPFTEPSGVLIMIYKCPVQSIVVQPIGLLFAKVFECCLFLLRSAVQKLICSLHQKRILVGFDLWESDRGFRKFRMLQCI